LTQSIVGFVINKQKSAHISSQYWRKKAKKGRKSQALLDNLEG